MTSLKRVVAMLYLSINLPHHRLRIQLSKRRRLFGEISILPDWSKIQNIRSGSKISRAVRHILERVNIKAILGGNLTLMILTTSLITRMSPTDIINTGTSEQNILPVAQTPLTTEISLRYPLNTIKINQSFSWYHPGVDLGGKTGDPIYPIAKGIVEITEYNRFGYGNSVVIDHGKGLKSRYAHLSRIDVRTGDDVNPNSSIGLVGSTGHSTGPHLHLETMQDDTRVNPLVFLSRN